MHIKVEGLCKTYQDADRRLVVLEAVTAEFSGGTSVAIVGKSGVGKSTLLHILGGLDRASKGEVYYESQPLSGLSDEELSAFRGENVGFIFQFHHLLPEFTALENAAMPLIIAGKDEQAAQAKAAAALAELGMAERLGHRPGELSGGEQQRVAIARAIANDPKVILADEPTGNLDAETAEVTSDLLRRMQRERGMTLIVVTHNMDLARSMDVVYEMVPGGELRLS